MILSDALIILFHSPSAFPDVHICGGSGVCVAVDNVRDFA